MDYPRPYPESPFKAPLHDAHTLNFLLAIIIMITLGIMAAALLNRIAGINVIGSHRALGAPHPLCLARIARVHGLASAGEIG